MTASELSRKLLYRGYDDMVDYLRNSPLNRCIYNVLVSHEFLYPAEVSMLTIFNEFYYLCIRINNDSTPGYDLERRYLEEEEKWLGSKESALKVFSIVWGMLRRKYERTFNEDCFVRGFFSLLAQSKYEHLAYVLIKYTSGDRLVLPKKFRKMPCPVKELSAVTTPEDANIWYDVTNGYSRSAIEGYLRSYKTKEDQLSLLRLIERISDNESVIVRNPIFSLLRGQIQKGSYIQSATEENDADYDEGMEQTYKEELEELKGKYQRQEQRHKAELAERKWFYENKIVELREKLEEMTLDLKREDDPSVLLFTFSEMVDIVKARFSKNGAEEFSNMLYMLATKHGYLDESISKSIDEIVPAVMRREARNTTVEIQSAHQVNVAPQTVNNHVKDEK